MSLTPNFGMNIPDSTDIVNLLTQCYPNFTIVDTALQAVKETGITTATETKSGTTHQLVRTDADCNVFRFTATSNFVTGDSFTVDGNPVTGVAVNGTSLQTGDFLINSNVLAILNGGVLTLFAGGASAPDASDVSYDNTGSGLTATDVQDAIDEVNGKFNSLDASDISYDNTGSGLTATDIQNAIDELAQGLTPTPFAWVGTSETWSNGLVTNTETESPATPELVSNCKIYAKIDTYFTSATGSLVIKIKQKNAGVWTSLYTKNYNTVGPHIEDHVIDISSYAGQEVKFAVTGTGTGLQLAITRFDVSNS